MTLPFLALSAHWNDNCAKPPGISSKHFQFTKRAITVDETISCEIHGRLLYSRISSYVQIPLFRHVKQTSLTQFVHCSIGTSTIESVAEMN